MEEYTSLLYRVCVQSTNCKVKILSIYVLYIQVIDREPRQKEIRIRIAIFACGFVVDSSSRRLTVDLQVATVFLGAAGEHQVVGGLDLEVLPLVLVLQETRGGGGGGIGRLASESFSWELWLNLLP